jgi:adenine nucleotide transporter 17
MASPLSTSAPAATPLSPQAMPAIFHAIGGSMGSALGLLLFYPLERARIEMQCIAAKNARTSPRSRQEVVLLENSWDDDQIYSRGTTKGCDDDGAVSLLSWTTAEYSIDEPFVDASMEVVADDESWEWDSNQSSSMNGVSIEKPRINTELDKRQQEDIGLMACLHILWRKNSLFRGVEPYVTTLAVSNFVFFFVNAWLKQLIAPKLASNDGNSFGRSYRLLLASCLAGICNVLMTNPLWLVNLRIVAGECSTSSLWTEMVQIVRKKGVRHLWTGTGTSILLVSNPVTQFFVYEQLKNAQGRAGSSLTPARAFATGALAKAIATVVTYPLQLTQVVLRLQQPVSGDNDEGRPNSSSREQVQQYKGIWDCLVKLYRQGGVKGLYRGIQTKLLQSVLTAAFTFLTYEQILRAVYAAHKSLVSKRKTA